MTDDLKANAPMVAGSFPTVGELFRTCASIN
jgi:hypothetical protein